MVLMKYLNPIYLIEQILFFIQAFIKAILLFAIKTLLSVLFMFIFLLTIYMMLHPNFSIIEYLQNLLFFIPSENELNRNPPKDAIQIIEEKRRIMLSRLNKPTYPPEIQISVSRKRLVEDSFNAIMPWIGKSRLHHARIEIRFIGEEGIDAGGLTREWLLELSKKMADPSFGLFRVSDVDNLTLILSSLPGVTQSVLPNFLSRVFSPHQMRLQYLQFFGMVVGKSIYETQMMDCHFSRSFYKQILGIQCDFTDLQDEDPSYFKHLLGMMDYSIDEAKLDLTFSVAEDENTNVPKIVDLKPNGRKIPVTDANKFEYITLMTEYKLMDRVKMQMDAFKSGLYEIIPLESLQIFNENELELLICGLPDIDIRDWKQNSEYMDSALLVNRNRSNSFLSSMTTSFIDSIGGTHKDRTVSTLISWFWRAVESFNTEQRANLLQFVTGTSKVPLGGFSNLRSSAQIRKFNILVDRSLRDSHLPSSRTCFNQLILPSYDSYEILRQKLLLAVTESSTGFGTT